MRSNLYEPKIILCPECGKHGYFDMPGVQHSLDFCSIEGAKKVLESDHVQHCLHRAEIQKLREALETIELPETDLDAPINIYADVYGWNKEFMMGLENQAVIQYAAHGYSQGGMGLKA